MNLNKEEIGLLIKGLENQFKIVQKDKELLNFYKNIYKKLLNGTELSISEFSKMRESLINYSRIIKDEDTKAKTKILSNKLANYIIDQFDALNSKKK